MSITDKISLWLLARCARRLFRVIAIDYNESSGCVRAIHMGIDEASLDNSCRELVTHLDDTDE